MQDKLCNKAKNTKQYIFISFDKKRSYTLKGLLILPKSKDYQSILSDYKNVYKYITFNF